MPMMRGSEIVPANSKMVSHLGGLTASHPFNDPHADMILRSSDGINFQVLRCILAISSPSIGRSFIERERTKSVAPYTDRSPLSPTSNLECELMAEESETLDSLLRIIYPVPSPELDTRDIDHLFKVVEAAMKYGMEKAVLYIRKILQNYLSPDLVDEIGGQINKKEPSEADIISIFSLSSHFRFEKEARSAARTFLRIPCSERIYSKYLSHISGATYFHLLDYRKRVIKTMSKVFLTLDFYNNVLHVSVFASSENSNGHVGECEDKQLETYFAASGEKCNQLTCSWWVEMRKRIISDLEEAPLRRDILTTSRLTNYLSLWLCPQCKERAYEVWDRFKELTYTYLIKEVNKVDLILPWRTESSIYNAIIPDTCDSG